MAISTNKLFVKQLIEFGLSEKEAKAYLALLELEVATVSELSKTADINRSTTYVVLEMLKKKGLVGISEDKKVQRYVAVSPDLLLDEAENKARKTEEIKNKINGIIPELKALHKGTKIKPKIRIFEGSVGLKEVHFDIFRARGTSDVKTFCNPVNMFKEVPDFIEKVQKREKKGIKMYAISPATKEVIEMIKHSPPPPIDEVILIPKKKFKFPIDMGIYGNTVAFADSKEKYGIIIENKEIADMIRGSFDLAWEEAKRISKNSN